MVNVVRQNELTQIKKLYDNIGTISLPQRGYTEIKIIELNKIQGVVHGTI